MRQRGFIAWQARRRQMKKHIKIVTIGVKHFKRAILKGGAAVLAIAVAAASLGVPANAAGTAETGIKSSVSSAANVSDDASTDFLTYYNLKIFDGELTGYEMKSQYDETDVPSGLSLEIPSGVTSIGKNAFSGFYQLKSVTIPSGVTDIGDGAFWECDGLTTASIPSGVKSIGDGAFGGCRNLTDVVIPSGVINISSNAFYYCTSLTSIDIPASVTSIGMSAFEECFNLDSVAFDSAQTLIYDDADTLPSQTVIYGYDPSTAKDYAAKYGRTFKLTTENPESIAVTTMPSKTTYKVGDSLDITGLVVTGTYGDGSKKTEPVTAADISGFDSSVPAESQTLTVTYEGKTATFTVQIKLDMKTLALWKDNNSFGNSDDSFFNGYYDKNGKFVPTESERYTLSPNLFDKLVANQSKIVKENLQNYYNSTTWTGSCFGISATMILSKLNDISIKNFDKNAQTYSQMDMKGSNGLVNTQVRDLINYYHLSQQLPNIDSVRASVRNPSKCPVLGYTAADVKNMLKTIVSKAKDVSAGSSPFMLDLYWLQYGGTGNKSIVNDGHTVVCNGFERDTDGYYMLQIVDPIVTDSYEDLYIADDYSSFKYNDGYNIDSSNWIGIGYLDVNAFNSIDIDGNTNSNVYSASAPDTGTGTAMTGTEMYIENPSGFTVNDAAGKQLSWGSDGSVTGNLSPTSINQITDSGEDGGPVHIHFPQTGAYTVTPTQDSMDVSMLDNGSFASVNETGAANMVFRSNNAVDINGNSITYTASVPDPKSDGNIQISSNSGKSVSIAQNSQGVVVSSSDLQNLTIETVREPDGENTSETVSTDKGSILIEDKAGDSTGAVQALVSSNNDGNFDKVIGQTAVTPASPTYSLVYTAGVGGTINGAGSQTVSKGGSGTAVTAVADSGYHFVKWSDGQTTAARVDKNVNCNINVTALFAANSGTAGSQNNSNPSGTNSQSRILNPNTGDDKMSFLSLIFAGIAICSAAFSIKLKKKR